MQRRRGSWIILLAILVFSACSRSPERLSATSASVTRMTPSPSPTLTKSPTPLPTTTSLPPTSTAIPTAQICSPLRGLALQDLPDAVVNPFNPPPPGSDDPHQGVDIADLRPGGRVALSGRAVQAVLPGRVMAALADRFPYGNALLVETPLEELLPAWLESLQLPTPGPTLEPRSALTCPEGFSTGVKSTRRSLYLLYAHLQEAPRLERGETVGCGQAIGAIGSSGNALNPHLHLEARLGPAGAQIESMAHYDTSATPGEMANYCAWRVSGLFQAFDPLRLLWPVP